MTVTLRTSRCELGHTNEVGMRKRGKLILNDLVVQCDEAGNNPERARRKKAAKFLSRASQNQRYVIWLLVVANPVIDGRGHQFTDTHQRHILVLPHEINQPWLAELAEIIFRFRNAVAVCEENIARRHLRCAFFKGQIVEKPDHHTARFQPAKGAVPSDDDWRQMPAVAIADGSRDPIVNTKEEGGVLLGRRTFV